jgi:hypothetical protein
MSRQRRFLHGEELEKQTTQAEAASENPLTQGTAREGKGQAGQGLEATVSRSPKVSPLPPPCSVVEAQWNPPSVAA